MLYILFISSLAVDENEFNKLNIYEIMISSFQDGNPNLEYGIGPSSFKGDLKGIINALEYIKDLGVNTILLKPPFDSINGQSGEVLQSHSYFSTDYFKIDPKFGEEKTIKQLVDKAHSLGLYILFDAVLGHHGGVQKPSPKGNLPSGQNSASTYPESFPYYTEFVQYWIEQLEIDGWRLDQCNQLYQNGHNYMKEIREAVYEVCDRRRKEGKQWGILGYIVGEDWDGVDGINKHTYSANGLKSAFDFNSRYYMIQGVAQEENGIGGFGIKTFANAHRTPEEKGYLKGVYPVLFVSNHETWRLGNIIKQKYNENVTSNAYWSHHKMIIGALAVYTGPISLYYGDEIGAITDCWHGNLRNCSDTTFSENCARSDGKINGFNTKQQNLHDFTKKLLDERTNHPAMYRGTYTKSFIGNTYFNLKYDSQTNDKVLYVTTLDTIAKTIDYEAKGDQLIDIINGDIILNNQGKFSIYLSPYETRVFKVVDNNSKLVHKKNNKVSSSHSLPSNLDDNKKSGIIICCACFAFVVCIVIGTTVYTNINKKKKSNADDNDSLLDDNSIYINITCN